MSNNGVHVFTSESVTEGTPTRSRPDFRRDPRRRDGRGPERPGRLRDPGHHGLAFIAGEITTETYVDFPSWCGRPSARSGTPAPSSGSTTRPARSSRRSTRSPPTSPWGRPRRGRRPGADVRVRLRRDAGADADPDPLRPQALHAPDRARRTGSWSGCARTASRSHHRVRQRPRPAVAAVVVSCQHADTVSIRELREEVREKIIDRVLPPAMMDDDTVVYINPPVASSSAGRRGTPA